MTHKFSRGKGDARTSPDDASPHPNVFWKYSVGVNVAEKKMVARPFSNTLLNELEGSIQKSRTLKSFANLSQQTA